MELQNWNVRWILETKRASISLWKSRRDWYRFFTRFWWQVGPLEYRGKPREKTA